MRRRQFFGGVLSIALLSGCFTVDDSSKTAEQQTQQGSRSPPAKTSTSQGEQIELTNADPATDRERTTSVATPATQTQTQTQTRTEQGSRTESPTRPEPTTTETPPTSEPTTTETPPTSEPPTDPGPEGYAVRVQFRGSWRVAIGTQDRVWSDRGGGSDTIEVPNEGTSLIAAEAQKLAGGSRTLTVQILDDGAVVKEASTDEAFGTASVTYEP